MNAPNAKTGGRHTVATTTATADPNVNRPGYKQTKVGWIPEEWETRHLGHAVVKEAGIKTGPFGSQLHQSDYVSEGVPVIMPVNMRDGQIIHNGIARVTKAKAASISPQLCKAGDILFARRGEIGRCAKITAKEAGWLNGTGSLRIRFRPDTMTQSFAVYAVSQPKLVHWLVTNAVGQTMLNLSAEIIQGLPIPLPPLPEQKKIAAILSTWDDAIEQTRALIRAKKQQKKALMQQLLTGKKRLPGFEGEWQPKTLSSLVTRIKDTADDPSQYPVLSITAGTGFVSQADKFSRVIAGKHIENYILLRRGEFSYNKGNSYRYPQGCVYQLHEYDEGLVPSVFYSYRVKPRKVHDAFLKHFFIAGLHNEQIYRWVNTGVRNNGLLNLNASDFFALKMSLPALDEQRAIAKVLDTADSEITSLEAKHKALQQQKKGLMQRLLTGQVRVKGK